MAAVGILKITSATALSQVPRDLCFVGYFEWYSVGHASRALVSSKGRNRLNAAQPPNTVGERIVALEIIARCSISQTPTGQWNINNIAV